MIGERIKERREELGMSQEELARRLGYKSRSSINKMELGIQDVPQRKIKEFARALNCTIGFLLEDERPKAKNIFIPRLKKVPMIGEIACGEPIYANEEYGEFGEIEESVNADFCLTAKGDSMTGARIHDGDLVFCKSTNFVDNGQIAAVVFEDSATLKRFYYYPDKDLLILKPDNPAFSDQIYSGEEINQINVIGKAVAFQSYVK